MKFLIVDDEQGAREDLMRAVCNVTGPAEIVMAKTAAEALEHAGRTVFDAIFLDINLPDMDGLITAREMTAIHPGTNIIIQTADPKFALEAYGLYVCDYILKPVSEKDIRRALEHLRWPVSEALPKLEVHCFGRFEVFWNGRPLKFGRNGSKELLAYLIDHRGELVSMDEIAYALCEDIGDVTRAKIHIRVFLCDLNHTLDRIGMGEVLVRKRGEAAICRDMLDCDYYRLLDGEPEASRRFRGEYMTQYSWAEYTEGELWFERPLSGLCMA